MRYYRKASLREVATITRAARRVDVEHGSEMSVHRYYDDADNLLLRSINFVLTGIWSHNIPIPRMEGV